VLFRSGLQPAAAGWAEAALRSPTRQILFAAGSGAGAQQTMTLTATDHVVFYIIQDDAEQRLPLPKGDYDVGLAIQDRSFNADGGLFYPANRAFFEGLGTGQDALGNPAAGLNIPFIPNSDISPIWNPEAFFNTIVVNGTT